MENLNEEKFRCNHILEGIDLQTPGLEISPLYRPITNKNHHNVHYTDYTSAEESRAKHADYDHPEIMELDFIWPPSKTLIECVPNDKKFDWAVASHVYEHIPDPLGWMLQVFEVLNIGATFSLVLPNKDYCFDRHRRNTEVSDIINMWLHKQTIPSPYQLYDFLRNSTSEGVTANNTDKHYTKEQALEFVLNAWTTGNYFDAHCSVYTPSSFYDVFNEINSLGLINAEVQKPIDASNEFIVKIVKLGEPKIIHPNNTYISIPQSISDDLAHARNAFLEAVRVQNKLKARIFYLENRKLNIIKRLISKFK